MKTTDSVRDLARGLIAWYNFKKNGKALLITGNFPAFEVLFSVFEDVGIKADIVDISHLDEVSGGYDYVVIAAGLESTVEPAKLMAVAAANLKDDGTLFLATFNRFNLGQFLGDKDVTTGHVLDGIDNYSQVSEKRMKEIGGHSYSKLEIDEMLAAVGLTVPQVFSVFPSLFRPQIMVRYGEKPNERFDARIQGMYNSPETLYLNKNNLYDDFLKNDLLHQMADGYLYICTKSQAGGKTDQTNNLDDIHEITVQTGRVPESAMATIVYTNKVVKKNMYSAGAAALQKIDDNAKYLRAHGVLVVEGQLTESGYETPFIKGQILTEYLRDILINVGREAFLAELSKFKNIFENSSRHLSYDEVDWTKFDPYWEKRKSDDPELYKWRDLANGTAEDKAAIGVVLERGYLDLAPINCFMTEDGSVFFDQEFYVPQIPANAIFLRLIEVVYAYWPEGYRLLPMDEVLDYFNLKTNAEIFRLQVSKNLIDFINDQELAAYNRKVRADYNTIVNNRFRMDYTQDQYEKLFTDIFKDVEGKKIYLFGSGDYAKKFIEKFRNEYKIAACIDNNEGKWGTDVEGIPICSPEALVNETEGYKVFICIKFYDDVLAQLKDMAVPNIAVFDPRLDYPRPLKHVAEATEGRPAKKYHIGYVAGVFDMFHIGHLNLLRRAKEQCDYLIVGVVTDQQIMHNKKTRPVIPFEQRYAIVQGCRYVDEAVTIPADNASTEYAYRTYRFDAQFSGSDYADDPNWLAVKEWLHQQGSDLVFFPYTEEISSTMLKGQLRDSSQEEEKS